MHLILLLAIVLLQSKLTAYSQNVPHCEIPEAPEGGTVFIAGRIPLVFSLAIYKCQKSLQLVGFAVTKCLEEGYWNHDPPKCVAPCSVPRIEHGHIGRYDEEMEFEVLEEYTNLQDNENLYLRCDKGFEPLGKDTYEEIVTCGAGTWTEAPRCQPARCNLNEVRIPDFVEDVNSLPLLDTDPKQIYMSGEQVCPNCNIGYSLVDPQRTLTCQRGEWTGTYPLCEDIDECALGISDCDDRHICRNLPGSFECDCPDGFILNEQTQLCEDIDECQEANVCNDDEAVCTNIAGDYKCTPIICPLDYIKEKERTCKSTDMICYPDDTQCWDKPICIMHSFATHRSNEAPPNGWLELFTLTGPVNELATVRFELRIANVQAPEGVAPATMENFDLRVDDSISEGRVGMINPIPGPQDIELELVEKIFNADQLNGVHVAKIFLFITEY